MSLSTYESTAIADVFVTLRSREARAAIAMVDALAALRLEPMRASYEVDRPADHPAFMGLVAWQITARGYALHGFDVAFERRMQPRGRAH